ncbi:hypothetical protein HK096_001540 [Nowakowskiella sp. JEL0078]|nr:hypothetical protein HK096_001540 [Nowakowskiella sp. JEL0078]
MATIDSNSIEKQTVSNRHIIMKTSSKVNLLSDGVYISNLTAVCKKAYPETSNLVGTTGIVNDFLNKTKLTEWCTTLWVKYGNRYHEIVYGHITTYAIMSFPKAIGDALPEMLISGPSFSIYDFNPAFNSSLAILRILSCPSAIPARFLSKVIENSEPTTKFISISFTAPSHRILILSFCLTLLAIISTFLPVQFSGKSEYSETEVKDANKKFKSGIVNLIFSEIVSRSLGYEAKKLDGVPLLRASKIKTNKFGVESHHSGIEVIRYEPLLDEDESDKFLQEVL